MASWGPFAPKCAIACVCVQKKSPACDEEAIFTSPSFSYSEREREQVPAYYALHECRNGGLHCEKLRYSNDSSNIPALALRNLPIPSLHPWPFPARSAFPEEATLFCARIIADKFGAITITQGLLLFCLHLLLRAVCVCVLCTRGRRTSSERASLTRVAKLLTA